MILILKLLILISQSSFAISDFQHLEKLEMIRNGNIKKYDKKILDKPYSQERMVKYVQKYLKSKDKYTASELRFIYDFYNFFQPYGRKYKSYDEFIPEMLIRGFSQACYHKSSDFLPLLHSRIKHFCAAKLRSHKFQLYQIISNYISDKNADNCFTELLVTTLVWTLHEGYDINIYRSLKPNDAEITAYLEAIQTPFLREKIEELKAAAKLRKSVNIDAQVKSNNDQSALSAYLKSPYTIIDCWASWCRPCIKSFPIIDERITDDDFPVIGICTDEADRCDRRIRKSKLKHMKLIRPVDSDGIFQDFKPVAYPSYIIVDKTGTIVSEVYHRFDDVVDAYKKLIDD